MVRAFDPGPNDESSQVFEDPIGGRIRSHYFHFLNSLLTFRSVFDKQIWVHPQVDVVGEPQLSRQPCEMGLRSG